MVNALRPRLVIRTRRGADCGRAAGWLAGVAMLAAALGVGAPAARAVEPGTSINAGAFFASVTADESALGFSVTDDRGMRLWSGWRDLGGENALGAPVSRRFLLDGWVRQVFERGLLRADPARGASIVNVLDFLSARGHDAQLLKDFGIPASADWSADEGQSWTDIRQRHLALLEGAEPWRVALRAAFRTAREPLANNDAALALYGLPMALAQTDMGYALRTQRAAWVYDPDTDAAPRRISVLEMLRAAELIPAHATVPHRADQRPHLQPPRPVSAVHFFDWWRPDYLPTDYFTHGLSWERIGLTREEIGSSAYYDVNFRLIRDLGVDGVVWEWYEGVDLTPTPVVLDSLRRHGLKIGLFYDWELLHAGSQPALSEQDYIAADEASVSKIADEVIAFYQEIPRDLWLYDADGRLPVIVYAFGFPEVLEDVDGWTWFFTELAGRVETALEVDVIFDWTAETRVQALAFERWPDDYASFNFVVDAPQWQFGHHVVTWNYIFDNRGGARGTRLRVIRDDNRYLQETAWLAAHTNPSLIFIYSWNEFWEGSHLFPDDTYEWRRYELARAQLAKLAETRADDLPRAVIIGDAADAYPQGTNGLFESQRLLLRHLLRRYVPQADFMTPAQVSQDALAGYDLIVSLTTDRTVDSVLVELPESVQIVYWNATDLSTDLAQRFAQAAATERPAGEFHLLDDDGATTDDTINLGGDVWLATPAVGTEIALAFEFEGKSYPLVVRADNDHWINVYGPTEAAMVAAFETVYGRELELAITFALGHRIQRLEVYPDGRVVQNTFSAPAVFLHEPLAIPDFEPVPPRDVPADVAVPA
ncbi:MAG: hypothetical protein OXG33_07480 [Chloroflexi bacterium]|nr:hypothetical protein [Chloroflexota bacterium]